MRVADHIVYIGIITSIIKSLLLLNNIYIAILIVKILLTAAEH